jgi:hypothetical protein
MRTIILSILLCLAVLQNATAQTFKWAKQVGVGTDDQVVLAVSTDPSGNVLTTGYFKGTADFDPGSATTSLTSNGYADIFIEKQDASGNLIWVKQIGGTEHEQACSIVTNASGDVYVSGYFTYDVDFDPGPGTFKLTTPFNYRSCLFLLKLDSNGDFVWAVKEYPASWQPYDLGLNPISIDKNGFIYMAKHDPQGFCVNKYDPGTGSQLWSKEVDLYPGSNARIERPRIAIDGNGNIYFAGTYWGDADVDPGPAVNVVSCYYYTFVLKLDPGGNYVWAKTFRDGRNWVSSIAADATGNVYICGTFLGTVDFDPGTGVINKTNNSVSGTNMFLVKLDGNGNFAWVNHYLSTVNYEPYNLFADQDNNIYMTGEFENAVNFNPNYSYYSLSSSGALDAFVVKYNPSGNVVWGRSMGGTASDAAAAVTVDKNKNAYVVGAFKGNANFDKKYGYNLLSVGGYDGFVVKLENCKLSIDKALSWNGVTLSTNESGDTYQWVDCNNNFAVIPGANTKYYTPTTNGSYAVVVANSECVPDTSACQSITVSIHDPIAVTINVFPNPGNGIYTIEAGFDARIVVVDIFGKKVLETALTAGRNSINLQSYPSGIYHARILSNTRSAMIQLVKE